MDSDQATAIVATAITTATPLVFAGLGETISERAGVINLSAEGTILMGAMTGFVVAQKTQNLGLGFAAAAVVGILIALIVAFGSITLKQSQVAIGFVLALLCSDLSSFLGSPFVLTTGLTVPSLPIPGLSSIPIVGKVLFQGDVLVYSSYLLIGGTWILFYRTSQGLLLRSLGEQPAAAFVRGSNVIFWRYFYTLLGGSLMGIAGAAFSLDFKAGWTYRHTAGYGWIVLAIVIFGGWDPIRVALGAYLFGILQSFASLAQSSLPTVPTQVFSVAPFVLMIGVLVLTSSDVLQKILAPFPVGIRRSLLRTLRATPPAALGRVFQQD